MTEVFKRCSGCEQNLPATTVYFYRDKYKPDGLDSACKQCKAIRKGKRYRKPAPPAPKGCKWCRSCEEIKSTDEFYTDPTHKDGFGTNCRQCRAENEGFVYRKRARSGYKYCTSCEEEFPATGQHFYQKRAGLSSWCIICTKNNVAEWSKNNAEQAASTKKRWVENNRDKTRISTLKYYYANKEKFKERYRATYQKHLERGRAWYWKNLEKARELARTNAKRWRERKPFSAKAVMQRRQARKRSLPDTLTADQWRSALDYFGGCCAYCGRPAGLFHTMAIEHFVPLSNPACPGTTALNCVPACHGQLGCNNQKHTKPAAIWLESKFGKRKAAEILAKIETYFQWVKTQPE